MTLKRSRGRNWSRGTRGSTERNKTGAQEPPAPGTRPAHTQQHRNDSLEAVELGALPVAALGVVADRVAGAQADPVGERAVLLAQVAHQTLDAESLVSGHFTK